MLCFSEEEKAVANAVYSGDLESLKLLLETREDRNPVIYVDNLGNNATVLHEAAFGGQVKIIKWYHENLTFEDINPLGGLYLCYSAIVGH